MVASIIFSITLANDESDRRFLEVFAALQQHCVHNEPGTLTYELHQVFENSAPVPRKYIVLERYSDMHHAQDIHSTSKPFQALIEALDDLEITEKSLIVASNESCQPLLDAQPPMWSPSNIENPLLRKGVLVFCGARNGSRPEYAEEARALARYIVEEARQPFVYGGGTVGVMGTVVQAVKELNGQIISVIPSALAPREVSGHTLGDLIYNTATMSERKSVMFAHSDTVVALPGGVGTFDELLEVITLFQLNAYRPKIGIVNVKGFFDPFIALLHHLVAEGFLEDKVFDFVVIKPTAVELMKALKHHQLPESPYATLKWHSRP